MPLYSSSPGKEMVYHFTLWPEGERVLSDLLRSYYLSIKKPDAKVQLPKHKHGAKGHSYFENILSLFTLDSPLPEHCIAHHSWLFMF